MITTWPSPAKINLFLYITGQRRDGYHTLQTLFQFLDYSDVITIEPLDNGKIHILNSVEKISDKENLIFRAALLLKKTAIRKRRLSINSGANISIEKRLFIGGGLGGGSSNAATVLVALNYLWNCGFSKKELEELGLILGSDVPAFIRGYTAFVEGIGEKLSYISFPTRWYLIIYPNVSISTSLIFLDPQLPRNTPKRPIKALLKSKFDNDCEIIVRKRFKNVDIALTWLLKYAPYSRLTGTGSCIFTEFCTEHAALQVLKKIPKWMSGFVAKSVNFSPLKKAVVKYGFKS